jgi:Flp pilus assembly protein TadG
MASRQPNVFLSQLQRFRKQSRGNVAITFALAMLPIVGLVGAAVDYSHANSVKAAMQAAADSTALMLSKTVSGLSDSQVTQKANDYFKALFTRPEASDLMVNASYSKAGGSKITVDASSTVKTDFMRLMGFSSLKVAVDSQVRWGGGKLQVALALDNTGSMASSGKITALKTATLNLLDTLKNAAVNIDDVQVSVVPFAKDVNVGKDKVNAPWIRWDTWTPASGGLSNAGMTGSICYQGQLWTVNGSNFNYGGTCTGTSTGICYNGQLWNFNGTTFVTTGTCGASNADHSSWNGCIADRDQDYDTKNASPNPGAIATLFPAQQETFCPAQMTGLTNNWSALTTLVNSMVPTGTTNQQIGLAWAWMTLTPGEPMNAPVKGPDTRQVIILLSDGMNTQNRWSTVQAEIDARQATLCTNIKAAGITIYAVQVNTAADPLSLVMKNCATDASKFFMLTSADQIIATFSDIGTKISKLRISN